MRHDLGNISVTMLTALEALYLSRKTTLAAERLGVAQPSMSVYLRQLRELTGDELFIRTAKGLEPTSFCHEYYEQARQILDALEDLSSRTNIAFDPKKMPAHFTVALPFVKSRMLFDGLSVDLMKRYPQMHVDAIYFREHDAIRHMETGQIDIYIGLITEKLAKQFTAMKLLRTELAVLCSNKSAYYKKGRITRAEYIDTPHIKASASFEPSFLDAKFMQQGLLQKKLVTVPDVRAELVMLEKTDFLLVMDRKDAEGVIKNSRLKILETDFDLPQFDFYMVWHARRKNDPPHKWYRNYIRYYCQEVAV